MVLRRPEWSIIRMLTPGAKIVEVATHRPLYEYVRPILGGTISAADHFNAEEEIALEVF
jgi:hypothetical protein